jgi:acetylornithine deacetylase
LASTGVNWDLVDRAIDDGRGEMVEFLGRLVAQPSTVGNEVGAQEVLAARLEQLGFEVERLPVRPDAGALSGAGSPSRSYDGRYNIIGRRGQGSPHLIVNGHIDVVPADEPGLWSGAPFQPVIADGWLQGRGAGDMKCGFAMLSLALGALEEAAPGAVRGRTTVVSAIEEECTGNGTLSSLADGVVADAALLVEPTGLEIMVGGVGILWFEVTVLGRSAHAESADRAVNPVDPSLVILAALRRLEATINQEAAADPALVGAAHPYNLNLGVVRAGDWQSSVPASARFGYRLAFPRDWTSDDAEARVRDAIARAAKSDPWLREHAPEVRFNGFRAPGYLLEADHALVSTLSRAHAEAIGTPPPTMAMASTTDARSYLAAGIAAVAYGPRVRHIHGIDEAVDLQSIVDGARVLARFLVHWQQEMSQS